MHLKISLGMDHGAQNLRAAILQTIADLGCVVTDHGAHGPASVDYPDFAAPVCRDVASGAADFGILCCTTGIGMSMSANKFPGVRAALVHFEDEAQLTRQHNNANVLCLGALHTDPAAAAALLRIFLQTPFDGGERHARRVAKINDTPTHCC
jgi:RpiB/LacA/LacB family sugar-phosphate isomerase